MHQDATLSRSRIGEGGEGRIPTHKKKNTYQKTISILRKTVLASYFFTLFPIHSYENTM